MKYEAKAWKETEGACLRNFKEQAQIDSVNGALALRSQIEKIIDQIWEEGFDGIYFIGIGGTYASSMQVEVYMRGRSKLPVFVENAAEFLTTGNKKFTNKSVVIISSVSGNTKEMVELVDRVHEKGAKVFSFIDNPGTILTQPDKQDYLIVYPMNEQLKFYMVANYLMYKNGEFDDYDRYNKEMEANLADVLVQVEKDSDEWAYEYAKNKVAFWKEHKDLPHYFIGSGNQYGATWCPPCKAEMPDIQKIYEEYQEKGDDSLVILGIAAPNWGQEQSQEGITAFLEEMGYTYPVVMDTTGEMFMAYGISSFPTTFMIDKEGNVFGYASGQLSEDMMRSIIRQTVEGKRE